MLQNRRKISFLEKGGEILFQNKIQIPAHTLKGLSSVTEWQRMGWFDRIKLEELLMVNENHPLLLRFLSHVFQRYCKKLATLFVIWSTS